MSEEDHSTLNTTPEAPVKLTKKGKPRKPHEMTPARIAAFEKCAETRRRNIEIKKRTKNITCKDITPEELDAEKDALLAGV